MYEDGKERIGKLNAREQQSKKRFDEKSAAHEQRLQTIEVVGKGLLACGLWMQANLTQDR